MKYQDLSFEERVQKEIDLKKQMKKWKKENIKNHLLVDNFYGLTLEQIKQIRDIKEEEHEGAEIFWNNYVKEIEYLF
jgi:predicted SpoU family rRNA methylase